MITRRARNNQGIAPLLVFGIGALIAMTIICVTAKGCEKDPPPQPVNVNVVVNMPSSTGNTTISTSVTFDPANPTDTIVTITPNNGNIGNVPDGDVHANGNGNPEGPSNTNTPTNANGNVPDANANTPANANVPDVNSNVPQTNGNVPGANSNVPQANGNQDPAIIFKQTQPAASPQNR